MEIRREAELGGITHTVSLNEPVVRYPGNPILTARQVNAVWTEPHRQVVTVHNAGVAVVGDETVMLFRSHLRSGVSVIGLARSRDGLTGWRVDPEPFLRPARAGRPDGVRRRRGRTGRDGVRRRRGSPDQPDRRHLRHHLQRLRRRRSATGSGSRSPLTDDFTDVTRYGPMLDADMRNVVLFPERIGGRYVGLFRPNDELPGDTGGAFRRSASAPPMDFRTGPWEIAAEPVMRTHGSPSAFADKIGPGAPPVRTRHGWLNLFHGVRATMDGHPYVLGVALHDLDDPERVQMSSIPVLFPSRADCRVAETDYVHVPNVVFSCAMLRRDDGVAAHLLRRQRHGDERRPSATRTCWPSCANGTARTPARGGCDTRSDRAMAHVAGP